LIAVTLLSTPGCILVRAHGEARAGRSLALTACRDGETPMQRSTLYFGAAIPNSADSVDAAEWLQFLEGEVTPRFPDGLTWHEAHGQWRGADGRVVGEASRVLILLHADDADALAAIAAIRGEYQRAFAQEAVLHEHVRVCAAF
jgi:hypothetical protein